MFYFSIVSIELLLSRLCEGDDDGDDKVVTELRTELWEKERKLTDIRLEALNSAHHLEQLQEAMINMQVELLFYIYDKTPILMYSMEMFRDTFVITRW